MLIDRKPKHQNQVLTEEKLDEIGACLQQSPRKSLESLTQKTGLSNGSVRVATKLVKVQPYKPTVVNKLQPCDSVARLSFCH
jgi:hypothetical protein